MDEKYFSRVEANLSNFGLHPDEFTEDEINAMIQEEIDRDNPKMTILDGYAISLGRYAMAKTLYNSEIDKMLAKERRTISDSERRRIVRDMRIAGKGLIIE